VAAAVAAVAVPAAVDAVEAPVADPLAAAVAPAAVAPAAADAVVPVADPLAAAVAPVAAAPAAADVALVAADPLAVDVAPAAAAPAAADEVVVPAADPLVVGVALAAAAPAAVDAAAAWPAVVLAGLHWAASAGRMVVGHCAHLPDGRCSPADSVERWGEAYWSDHLRTVYWAARSAAACSADHSGLPAVLKAAYPCARYWAYRPDDSAAHCLAAANYSAALR
jgi:hypothetical protein